MCFYLFFNTTLILYIIIINRCIQPDKLYSFINFRIHSFNSKFIINKYSLYKGKLDITYSIYGDHVSCWLWCNFFPFLLIIINKRGRLYAGVIVYYNIDLVYNKHIAKWLYFTGYYLFYFILIIWRIRVLIFLVLSVHDSVT
jgi:hypothetical protein